MLTLKLITEETDRVISGLEKKHFAGAKEAIDNVLAIDKRRRESQQMLDKTKQEAKLMASKIGALMKEGKKDEAEEIKKMLENDFNVEIIKDISGIDRIIKAELK